ncbi:MAG: glycosyltransferase [Bacteroidota bacterium]
MEFTGERFIASLTSAQISYEHWHRYLFASEFVKDKRVLDIASGDGYGCSILGKTAKDVIGVDNSPEAISWASQNYKYENINFIEGSCANIPIVGEYVFDIIVSFETIEHIGSEEQQLFFNEIKRLLKPDGILMISTPNKKFYSDKEGYSNEFHLKEFYREEFELFLKKYFLYVEIGGQKMYSSSWIWPMNKKESQFHEHNIEYTINGFLPTDNIKEDLYDIAICSNEKSINFPYSGLTDISQYIQKEENSYFNGLLKNKDIIIQEKDFIIHQNKVEIVEKENIILENECQIKKGNRIVKEKELQIQQEQNIIHDKIKIIENKDNFIKWLEKQLRDKADIIQEKDDFIHYEYEQMLEKECQINERNNIIKEKDETINFLRSSVSWKLTKPFRITHAFLIRIYRIIGKVITIYKNIRLLAKCELFDRNYYLAQNPDFKYARIFPILHYLLFGGFEGRNPSPRFHSGFYLDKNKDVFNSGMNPLVHFILNGEKEGRIPTAYIGVFDAVSKDDYLNQKNDLFYEFIKSGSKMVFPDTLPSISIILVLYNAVELTFDCLQSINKYADIPYEVIIIDNNSTDRTHILLDKIKGANIIRNRENQHFLKGCNQAMQYVKSDYILFFNNDAVLLEGSLESAYRTLSADSDCGAVGGKIVLPDGRLQEAGSIIWKDGSCLGYGRGEMPDLPEYNFNRVVDYCSGAFLMTRTELFRDYGGFDINYIPAYYEETDYCLWLQEHGLKVIYEPRAVIRHYEFGSGVKEGAILLQKKNQKIFYEKHKVQLSKHFYPDLNKLLSARFAASQQKNKMLLYIDDRVPHAALGSGFPRSNTIVRCIQELGYNVTILPLNFPQENWTNAYNDIDSYTEVVMGCGLANFSEFIQNRKDYYDYIWISRPHNMKALHGFISSYAKSSIIIYDAEAIFAERDINKKIFEGDTFDTNAIETNIRKELSISDIANIVTTVSITDAEKFRKYGKTNVHVLGHTLAVIESKSGFDERNGLLFVGNLDYDDTPNVDSILWFVNEIFPIIWKKLPNIKLDIVGSCNAKSISSLNVKGVHVHGRVDEIWEFYNKCRIFIAPTRYAAGIPYKIHEAAAFGLPVVATELLVRQLGWTNKEYVLSSKLDKNDFAAKVIELYHNRNLWESISARAFTCVKEEMSYADYKQKIANIFSSI